MILAAIDIGSNAVRLLICEVVKKGKEVRFNKLCLLRIPVRLGFDVFEKGHIGGQKKKMLINTIKAFNNLMKVYEVEHYMACATSAMRDAENAKEIIKEIKSETSIEIEVITGELEAEIIYENHIAELLDKDKSYLYIDVGGGSTEITLYHKSNVVVQKSFNIGTVRILTKKVKDETWEEMKETLKDLSKKYNNMIGIGSGGNINKLFSLNGNKNGKFISAESLKEVNKEMEPLTVEERMDKYTLKEDRAEVIVPALSIYNAICKWADIEEIYVPKIGLADGLIHHLYDMVEHE
ncbi:MAG: exopolyphosphatase [Bacteroidetes bacterium]|nr:exopolyphosphatase [Bacteroidota bacterium]